MMLCELLKMVRGGEGQRDGEILHIFNFLDYRFQDFLHVLHNESVP